MRAFWAIIGVMMLAAAVYLLSGGLREKAASPSAGETQRRAQRTAPGSPMQDAPRALAAAPQASPAGDRQATPDSTAVAPRVERSPTAEPAPSSEQATASASAPTSASAGANDRETVKSEDVHSAAHEAQAILSQWQGEQGDWARVTRLWMSDVHAHVERTWRSPKEAEEVARDAVRQESHWRSIYLEMASERLSHGLREQGLTGDELAARTNVLMRGLEDAVVESVLIGVFARRQSAAAAGELALDQNQNPIPTESSEPTEALADADAAKSASETAQKTVVTTTPSGTSSPPAPSGSSPAQQPAAPTVESEPSPAAPTEWLVKRDDGSMMADGRYLIRGSGSQEDPYKISWEHLISAEEEYVPRDGRTEIPKRIQMLDGKHVEITGYVAFPLLLDSADELLVMLNQWDGCCLGLPPTPYDAVEVLLKDVVEGNARMASYGTVRGTFKVDPHLVGGWLVGLYLLENAKLEPLAFGGFAP